MKGYRLLGSFEPDPEPVAQALRRKGFFVIASIIKTAITPYIMKLNS